VSAFLVPDLPTTGTVTLPQEELHHALRTLRCRVGEEVYLTNGQGLLATARFVEVSWQRGVLEILSVEDRPGEPPAAVGLAVSFLKAPDRIGWLVEKAVELGVTHLYFMPFGRSVPRRPSLGRLQRIAAAAIKQNLRSVLPEIRVLNRLEELPWEKFSDKLFGEIGSERALWEALPAVGRSNLWIVGPEGDFIEAEVKRLRVLGVTGVSLGRLRLRAETAAVCYLAALKTAWGY